MDFLGLESTENRNGACVVNGKNSQWRWWDQDQAQAAPLFFSQAHKDLKSWISNDGLFLADLFGLNCYVFSAYF